MKLYVIRHGESESNAQEIYQGAESPLSEKGLAQTKLLAKRVAKLNDIDLIVASPYVRTRQTAEEILKLKPNKIIYSDLAVELKRPSETLGKSWQGLFVQEIKREIQQNAYDPDWHYSDEENFTEFKKRTIELIKYIESFGDKNILLVAHGLLAKMMVGVMLFGFDLSPKEHESIDRFIKKENTGITLLEKKENKNWRLISWNDHAHLA